MCDRFDLERGAGGRGRGVGEGVNQRTQKRLFGVTSTRTTLAVGWRHAGARVAVGRGSLVGRSSAGRSRSVG